MQMNSLIYLWKFVKPYRSRIWLNIGFNILSAIFSIFSLLMLIPILKLLFSKTNVSEVEVLPPIAEWNLTSIKINGELWLNHQLTILKESQGEVYALVVVCLAVILIFFLKNFFHYLGLYVVATIKKGVVKGLHTYFYQHLLHFSLPFFHQQKKGDLISRFTSDIQEVEYGIISFLASFLKDPIYIVFTLATMFFLSPKLTLIVFITLPISGIVIGLIGKQLKHESKMAQTMLSKLVARIDESISGIRVIKAFTAQQYLEKAFELDNESHFKWSKKMLRKRDLSAPVSELLGIIAVAIIILLGGRMVFSNQIQPETFIAYIVIFSQIISPSKAFANAYYFVQKGRASLERIEEIMEDKSAKEMVDSGESIQAFNHSLVFENVDFNYGNTVVLKQINFEIKKGDKVALVGQSGAGKSTLVDLLLNFYDLNSGRILVDGRDLKTIRKTDWRNLLALVPQDSVLFNDTLYNNILFGRPNATKAEVLQAAKFAQVDAFIGDLNNGYDTIVGDNGGNLSGGQKQRVAIARAFLKQASILIFDEATSALDADNENIIAEALGNFSSEVTVIIIAHRSATIAKCDTVIALENGSIKSIDRKETVA
jgi:subfamily B ATP-binding cassette protein MsbA